MTIIELAGYADKAIEFLTLVGQLGFVAAAWKLARKVDARQTAHEAKHAEHVAQDTVFQVEVRAHLGMSQPSVH